MLGRSLPPLLSPLVSSLSLLAAPPLGWRTRFSLVLALGVLLAALESVARAEPPRDPADDDLVLRVKSALLELDDLDPGTVSVDGEKGVVWLDGELASEAQERGVLAAVRSVDGVRDVRDGLEVRAEAVTAAAPTSPGREVGAPDDEALRTRVEEALASHLRLAESGIEVAEVSDGIVTLRGEAPSYTALHDATYLVRMLSGVRGVRSRVTAPPTPPAVSYGYPGLGETMGGEAPGTGTERRTDRVGPGAEDLPRSARDLDITGRVKLRFVQDPLVPAELHVDTRDGVVTLFGRVPSAEASRRAEENARAVAGVREIRNRLEVTEESPRSPPDTAPEA